MRSKKNWDGVAFDPVTGEVNVEMTVEDRENVLPKNPPPGPKWRARKGLNMLQLSGAVRDFMECLIDRASKNTGGCWPSLEYIAGWTGRPYETIRSAAKEARRHGLVYIIERGRNIKGQERSNAYAIKWQILFAACRSIERFERTRARRSTGEISLQTPQNQRGNFTPASGEFSPPNLGIRTTEVNRNHDSGRGAPVGAPPRAAYAISDTGAIVPAYRRQA